MVLRYRTHSILGLESSQRTDVVWRSGVRRSRPLPTAMRRRSLRLRSSSGTASITAVGDGQVAGIGIQARDRLIRKLIEEGAAAARSCRKDIMTATDIFQRLYDSEINASVAWIYDSGFRWRLGDDLNGWKASGYARTIDEAARLLAQAAAVNYPASEFAQWWAGA